jgi:hypothetical protein
MADPLVAWYEAIAAEGSIVDFEWDESMCVPRRFTFQRRIACTGANGTVLRLWVRPTMTASMATLSWAVQYKVQLNIGTVAPWPSTYYFHDDTARFMQTIGGEVLRVVARHMQVGCGYD